MKRKAIITFWVFCLFLSTITRLSYAQVGGIIQFDDDRWASVGGGLRTTYESAEDGAPNKIDRSNNFEFESFRLYINSLVYKGIQFEFNTQGDSDSNFKVIDAVAKIMFTQNINVWMGRMVPPSGRANLSGPYFLNVFDFPFAEAYPNLFIGRDEGAALWGLANGDRFKYQFGLFEGRDGGSNQGDNLLYTGRLTYNFWDAEPAIYYNASTYHGDRDIFALGFVSMYQKEGAGTSSNRGDFLGWNVDLLMEKTIKYGGVVTLEAAYYKYDLDEVSDSALIQGDSYFLTVAHLFPKKIGWGRVQPFYRYQYFDQDQSNRLESRGTRERNDVGINYIISGHNARVSMFYAKENPGNNIFKLGLQLQLF